jgi:hypothetical protein
VVAFSYRSYEELWCKNHWLKVQSSMAFHQSQGVFVSQTKLGDLFSIFQHSIFQLEGAKCQVQARLINPWHLKSRK